MELTLAEKPIVALPAGTVTLAGTFRLAVLLARPTGKPTVGAEPLNETVQAILPEPMMVPGEQANPVKPTDCEAAVRETVDDFTMPFADAVIVAD